MTIEKRCVNNVRTTLIDDVRSSEVHENSGKRTVAGAGLSVEGWIVEGYLERKGEKNEYGPTPGSYVYIYIKRIGKCVRLGF